MTSKYILACAVFAFFSSCDNSTVFFEKNTAIESGKWDRINRSVYEVNVADTMRLYNFFFNVRNAGDYNYNNLWIFLHTHAPDGTQYKDTLECTLADRSGKWLGTSGSGGMWDNRVLFKTNTALKKSGIYTFEIEQAMRDETLSGIYDIGLRIEYITKH